MNSVTMRKAELQAIVVENRSKHRTVFEAAVEGYRNEAVRMLEDHIGRILNGKLERVYVSLPVPVDHTRDYDTALRMLELEVNDTVTLDTTTFAQLVQDDWKWRHEFLGTATTYAAATVQAAYGEISE